jgi:Galactose oxidase, central domain/Kelch motif
MVSSAVRLELRPGGWVLWKSRPFRFVCVQGSTASIRDSVNLRCFQRPIAADPEGPLKFAFREVIRLIPVLIGSAALCACSGSPTLFAASGAAGAGSSTSPSSGTTTPVTPTGGSGPYVGMNVLVSGLDSGMSMHFSVNGSTGSWGVINANGDVFVPGDDTELTVGSTYSLAITDQPPGENCAAANAYGTIGTSTPPNITITCVPMASSPSVIAASETSLGIKSTPSRTTPQARQGAASWTDPHGRLWMFGGNGNDADGGSVTFGDLWRLSPESSGWSLMSAAGLAPAARAYAASWSDANGDLWLFGGQGRDTNGTAYVLNDLWKFSESAGQWTRVSGSARKNMPGVYGLADVSAADNVPGGRSNAVAWIDPAGTLWLFGGYGIDSTGALGTLNDLWEFTPSTGLWTWASGSVTATGT